MSIQIGPLQVNDPVFLAPMSGITDRAFRSVVRGLGVPLVISEMIASGEVLRANQRTLRMMDMGEDAGLFILQLAGHDPDIMAEAARLNADRGAAIIDLNMGCPAKKVVNKYCGAALMREPDLARQIMRAVVRAVDIPVTLKMRLGWDEESFNAPEYACMAEEEGIQLITVHGRTRAQKYTGQADWAQVRRVKDATHLPVVVNGDILDFASIDAALTQSGADGIMIGRGACGRPWFLRQAMSYMRTGDRLPDPDMPARHQIMQDHLQGLLSCYGSEDGVRHARKHMGWYADHLPAGASMLKQQMFRAQDAQEMFALMDGYFTQQQDMAA